MSTGSVQRQEAGKAAGELEGVVKRSGSSSHSTPCFKSKGVTTGQRTFSDLTQLDSVRVSKAGQAPGTAGRTPFGTSASLGSCVHSSFPPVHTLGRQQVTTKVLSPHHPQGRPNPSFSLLTSARGISGNQWTEDRRFRLCQFHIK